MSSSTALNAVARDLGIILSADNTAAADKTQTSSPGTDTLGDLLSDRITQDTVRCRADAQSAADDVGRRADIAHKGATRISVANNDQDTKPVDGSTSAPSITTPTAGTADTATAKRLQPTNAKDLDTIVKQAAVDPAAQLTVQIEVARQIVQRAAIAQLPAALPAAPSTSNIDTDVTPSAASRSSTNGAAALTAASAAASRAQGSTDPAAMAQAGLARLPAAKDAKVNAVDTPTPPATVSPDSGTLAQTMARTRTAVDNALVTVCQLDSASSGQGANTDCGLPYRDLSPHNAPTQLAAATVVDAISHASNGSNTGNTDSAGTQSNAQGNGIQLQGVLSRVIDDGRMAASTFAVGGANADAAVGVLIASQRVHMLSTFGDVVWPQSVVGQLVFMQMHRQSSAELQLNPAELGSMYVKLEVDNGAVNTSFVCQHQTVAGLVQDVMLYLYDTMQQGGIRLAQTPANTGDLSQQRNALQGSSAQNQSSGSGNGKSGNHYSSSGS